MLVAPRGTAQVHSHRVTCFNMQVVNTLGVILLSYNTFSQAIAIPQFEELATMSTASGYRNVAYFVNWVCILAGALRGHPKLIPCRAFMDATISLRTFPLMN